MAFRGSGVQVPSAPPPQTGPSFPDSLPLPLRDSAAHPPAESLAGLIERVTFFNEDNGFAVLKVKVKGHRDLVAVVGSLPCVSAGEWLTAQGRWVRDRERGLQFQAEMLASSPPTSREGIARYLGSGLVKGVGPVCAKKLVARFGERILEVIEHESARIEEMDGIGPLRRRRIKAAWIEGKAVREIMVFLHSHGVSTSRAVRIHKTYGDEAIERVRRDPYTLARDIHGIGFKTADQIAQRIGIAPDSLQRAAAGLSHVLLEATQQGHCALPAETLFAEAGKLLLVNDAIVTTAFAQSLAAGEVVREAIAGQDLVFLPALLRAEQTIADRLKALLASPLNRPQVDAAAGIADFEQSNGKRLAPSQRAALEQALTQRVLVLTGGPGVGKTTLVNAILLVLRLGGGRNGGAAFRPLLCAPTGRAARRLSESTGLPAATIHRLLEAQSGGRFGRNESHPLEGDLLVVDETSMVDVSLMSHLLRAMPAAASLLLVGDVDQLPSVGPGSVLRDLLASGVVPVVRLTEVFRQAAESRIIANAHRINAGQLPESPAKDVPSDFYFVERNDPASATATLLELVQRRIPAKFGLDPVRDIQVLCPLNRGSLGVRELNVRLQTALNPAKPGQAIVERFGWQFRTGDKVIQTENNYDKAVFNGDIGLISDVDEVEQELRVRFDEREVAYDLGELDQLALAYAITIHKSQGSEFPAVVIPVAMQQFVLLQRNLLYTGVTRGKSLVVLIGEAKALACAVRNAKVSARWGGVCARLRE
jgi:exodeoxyribonuclease V alpha subunit